MSTYSFTDRPSPAVGRVRVPEYQKIETPNLSDRATVEAIFNEATRVAKAERSRRIIWRRKAR